MITVNGHKVTPTIFPDGTSQVWHLPEELFNDARYDVLWWFENEAELIHLVQLNWLLTRTFDRDCALMMPYFPYARQDKYTSNETSFALDPFIRTLRTITEWTDIYSYDVHFTLSLEHVLPLTNLKPPHLKMLCNKYDTLIFPDKGAAKRYQWIQHPRTVTCDKVRDQATGFITKFELNDKPEGSILVVDDLCDGGATFNVLAESVAKTYGTHYVANFDLYVTHGIFSKGIDDLLRWYGQIHTTNTYIKNQIRHHRLFIEQIC